MNKEQQLTYNEIISKYNFNEEQKEQIRLGLENNIDVTTYLNPTIYWKKMKRIRLELESNNE